jgi:hypothetical protein
MTNILASGSTTGDNDTQPPGEAAASPAAGSDKRHAGKKPESLFDPSPVRFSYG